MAPREALAIGLSVHTGWAAAVIVAGSPRAPRVEQRERLSILGNTQRFVFHRLAQVGLSDGKREYTQLQKAAHENAKSALSELLNAAAPNGSSISRCAIVAKAHAMPGSLDEIISSHSRIHTAEGCFYRDHLLNAASELGLKAEVVSPVGIEERAAKTLRSTEAEIGKLLAQLGKRIGPPWSKDQKLASLAAWMVLAERN